MKRPACVIGVGLLLTGVGSSAATAAGGLNPSSAPTVQIGQINFGSTDHVPNNGYYHYDFWRLPPLLARDRVTVAWKSDGLNLICVAGNVDDFDWPQSTCNRSEASILGGIGGALSERARLRVTAAANPAYLQFYECCSGAAYEFTVEAVQHSLGVAVRYAPVRRRRSTVIARVNLSNGRPARDGLRFALRATWAGGNRRVAARLSGGRLRFLLVLPKSAVGKTVELRVRRSEDANFLPVLSSASRSRVRA